MHSQQTMSEALYNMGLLRVCCTNDLMNWADWLNSSCMLIVMKRFLVWLPIYSVYLAFAGCPVALFKNDILLVLTWFSKMLLINAWLTVERIFPVLCNTQKIREMTRNLGARSAWLLKPTISKFCHSSYMVITLQNLKILLSLLLLSHPTI